jgi:cysteine synthase
MTNMSFVPGPTYDEMRDPSLLPDALREAANQALRNDELSPVNLFNIHWKDGLSDEARHLFLPRELTGVPCNIIMLTGVEFPSGSHKVGPAYSTLAEAEVDAAVTHDQTVVGPSTGNFGIGTAYISRLKGYKSLVVMPDSMSRERYERIQKYGGELELTPGTESDVILTLERVHEMRNPRLHVLAQFELLPNYRFHRHVTGSAALQAASAYGDGKVALFAAAPGSAGTLAAGDAIKAQFPECQVAALEPRECSTLYDGGLGTHRIEGIGDKMVTLIHNILTTDHVALVHDEASVKGLYLLHHGQDVMNRVLGVDTDLLNELSYRLGISCVCNLLGAIRMAKKLQIPAGENVVTVATDGVDRYHSCFRELEERNGGEISEKTMEQWVEDVFVNVTDDEVLDTRGDSQKERLYNMKEEVWTRFDYSKEYLDQMKSMDFWNAEYQKIPEYNDKIRLHRETNGGLPIYGTMASSPGPS